MMVRTIEQLGIGQRFRYVTAVVVPTCAALLTLPRTAWLTASPSTVTMMIVMAVHLFLIGDMPGPAIVLGALCGFVSYRPRGTGRCAARLAPSDR